MPVRQRQGYPQQEQDGSPQIGSPEKQSHTGQRHRHITDHIGFHDMPRLDNNDIIGCECKSERPGDREPPVHSHDTHQQVKTYQSDKYHSRIAIPHLFQPAIHNRIRRHIRCGLAISCHIRHPTEHRIRPDTELTRLCRLGVLIHLAMSHSGRLDIIALHDYFPIKHRR